jgi:hypothetical protein
MDSVLESVEWGKHPLSLLSQMKRLDTKKPAFIHIRHSERPLIDFNKDEKLNTPLSKRGEKVAYQFGSNLPLGREYIIHHTDMDRTVKTSENIKQGIEDNDGTACIVGEIPLATVVDMEAVVENLKKIKTGSESERSRIYLNSWISGMYPPWVMKPSLEFAQIGASLMSKDLKTALRGEVHIWISHDSWVFASLHHWFGETLFDCIDFMDGFILQLNDEDMNLFFRGRERQVAYPYWWRF